jgi:hypothetical protein
MEAIKRIELELQSHRKAITVIQQDILHEKSECKRILKSIELDIAGDNDAHNYGLIYEYADRICKHLKSIKELQQLIGLKLQIIANPLTPTK